MDELLEGEVELLAPSVRPNRKGVKMTEDLVRRQAEILADLDSLNDAELEALANAALPAGADDRARRLLRGLVRSRNVGRGNPTVISTCPCEEPTVVLAQRGFFVISAVPLSDGRYDREHVLKEPVVAWRVDAGNYAAPVIPGLAVTDRWAVLTPEGLVIGDEYSAMFGESPLALKDWIKSEIDWRESEEGQTERLLQTEDWPACSPAKH